MSTSRRKPYTTEELVTAMVDAAAPLPPSLSAGRSWRDYLSGWTRANRDFYLARSWLLRRLNGEKPNES